jgi:hypothetical protein
VVGVEQWAEIRRLHFVKGLSQREIRCRTGLHRDTIRRAISNKPFSAWGDIFGDDVVAAAMIDRLVHHAEILRPHRRQRPPQRPRPRPTAGRKLTPTATTHAGAAPPSAYGLGSAAPATQLVDGPGLLPRLLPYGTGSVPYREVDQPHNPKRAVHFHPHHRPTIRTALTNGGVRRGR